jgi:glycosyltransferase involved in cell wall biosynthesis
VSAASSVRRAVAPAARIAFGGVVGARTRRWLPYSRLFALGDRGGWSVDEDARQLEAAARRLGVPVAPPRWAAFAERQAVFHSSHFEALSPPWLGSSHRLGTAYLHGRPGTPGMPEFDAAHEALRRNARRLDRVQVTHAEMHELVLSAGVDDARVFRVPIGIDIEHFPLGDPALRRRARAALGVPEAAFVVGSFQKDGVGFGQGLEPKVVKGPDVLVAALERLHAGVPELHVLLTGLARGYVRRELARAGVPHTHLRASSRAELARAYHALDLYVVASRQEGGPKAVLESMATGVPIVSTRVGQAPDLIDPERSGLLVDVEDVDALVEAVLQVRAGVDWRAAGRATAEAHAYERLDPLWRELLDGFVEPF